MRVLVLGGTGSIGRCIVESLLNGNSDVTIFHRGHTNCSTPREVCVIKGDRKDRNAFEKKMESRDFDVVIDMISFSFEDAASAYRAFNGRIQHFIQCSTGMTYGPPFPRHGSNIKETDPLNGHSAYGLGKIAADNLLLNAYAKNGFPVTIMKPSYTYGPGNGIYRQIGGDTKWIDRLRRGKPILSITDGASRFQFLSTYDAGEGFAKVAGNKKCIGQVYNIVNTKAITWNEWHHAVAEALDVEPKIVFVTEEFLLKIAPEKFCGFAGNFGHKEVVFSGKKLEKDISTFRPKASLTESIRETIEWMDENGIIPNSDEDKIEDGILAMKPE